MGSGEALATTVVGAGGSSDVFMGSGEALATTVVGADGREYMVLLPGLKAAVEYMPTTQSPINTTANCS